MDWEGTIDGLTHEGLGIGTRIIEKNGVQHKRPIFIPYTAPGDTVRASIADEHGKYAHARLLEIITPGPHRAATRCPHYGICGGCNLQHVVYEEQLRQKAAQIAWLLDRVRIPHPAVTVLPARKLHKYRWRTRIALASERGVARAGFRKHRSREIVPISHCEIIMPELLDLIRILNGPLSLPDMETEIQAVAGERRKVGIILTLDDVPQPERVLDVFTRLYADNRELIGNLLVRERGRIRAHGQVQEHFAYTVDGLRMHYTPETFIQANISTNELLVAKALAMLAPTAEETVLDLYAGIGNIALPLAKRAAHVHAVEGVAASVDIGKMNAMHNAIANVTFHHAPIEQFLQRPPHAHAVVLDPPRTGCTPEVLAALNAMPVRAILYVSCNPVTLARDLRSLPGYRITQLLGIDMFPDISHVETLALLER